MKPDRDTSALLLVDIQPDFLPGGALAVAGGDEIVAPVGELMRSARSGVCIAPQAWHPPAHISFASRHKRSPFESIELYGHPQTLWPDHCVQGTAGAALHPALPFDRADAIIRKGTDPLVDSYSAFRNNWNAAGQRPSTGLAGYLRDRGIEQVFICGLARDVCVKWTAEDAAEAGFQTFVIWDLTRAVDPATDNGVQKNLRTRGVQIVRREQG